MMQRIKDWMTKPVDISSLVFFRIAFGFVMLWEVGRYLGKDWVERYFIDPDFYFTFQGFGWVSPLEGNAMYVFFLILGILAFCIMLGLFYRTSIVLFFFGFAYLFLLDKTNYLNHFYLITLLSFI
ncbi:MAG: HTTM domain-containing protein, partial [Saprospiraceae bacterium]|nr:HTTM domain-containing protein [Saprospiraceae bacterium]